MHIYILHFLIFDFDHAALWKCRDLEARWSLVLFLVLSVTDILQPTGDDCC